MPTTLVCRNRIYYFRYEGKILIEDLKEIIIDAHVKRPTKLMLQDYREASFKHLSKDEIRDIGLFAKQVKSDNKRTAYKASILVSDSTDYGLVRCALAYDAQRTERLTRVYYDIDYAIDWLTGVRE